MAPHCQRRPGREVQAFQHGVRNHLTRPRNLVAQAQMQPDELAANLQNAAAAAARTWELVRAFCAAVQAALDTKPRTP